MGGGSIKIPEPASVTKTTTPVPAVQDKEVQDAAAEAVRRRRRQKGFRSTILSTLISDSDRAKLQTLGS